MKPLLFLVLFFFLASAIVIADDTYKPYLHKAEIPEHPKVRLFGSYQTSLFPGAATYSYPIDVPPGTNGLAPSLSIIYNSQNAKSRPGILGAGWEFTNDYIIKNINGTPETSDDFYTLFLNGRSEKLVVNGSELRTEIEYDARIQSFTDAPNDDGNYWIVTTKDGKQHRFGYTADSELITGLSTRWSLDQVQDTFGNTITYTYLENPGLNDANAVYLSTIEYNRDKLRSVQFHYENGTRSDRRRTGREGAEFEESLRLQSIEVSAKDILVRRYAFGYESITTSATTLSTITQFGNDNNSILHTIHFNYNLPITGFTNQTTKWIGPSVFADTASVDFGVRIIDVNNDGFVDILKAREKTGEKGVFLNNKLGNWTNSSEFRPQLNFVYGATDKDNGVRFADINGDGLLDMLQSANNNGSIKKVFVNNESGWTDVTAGWTIPVYFVVGDVELGTEFADVNGDGKTDIIYAYNGTRTVYMNTGSGWSPNGIWTFPVDLVTANKDTGARVVDLNGDNLPDIIQSANLGSDTRITWVNNGSGWRINNSWTAPVLFTTTGQADMGVRFADMNGDGLIDLVQGFKNASGTTLATWLNTGVGWEQNDSWQVPEPFVINGLNSGRRLADVDGDGIADQMISIGNSSNPQGNTWTKNNSFGLLLHSITNEYGGTVTINYTSSTKYDNRGGDNVSDLGFAIYVVERVDTNNSVSGPFNVVSSSNYSYAGGLYDAADVQFRGFSNVTEIEPDSTIVKHYFHQDDALKGREFKIETVDSNGIVSIKLMNYSAQFINPNTRILLRSEETQQYDGNLEPFSTLATYAYDEYGNLIEKDSFGNPTIFDDTRIEKYSYEFSLENHILDKPATYQLFEWDNETKVKETSFGYDEGLLSKGCLTRIQEWNDRGDDKVVRNTCDDFGNKVSMLDPLGRFTSYDYGLRDGSHTYLERNTNALGHAEDYTYDFATGNLLSKTKNGIRILYEYDEFGRITKEIQPYDSSELPTKKYNYSFNGVAPEIISLSLRETGETTNKILQYAYDGIANVIQIRSDAGQNGQVVKNLYYDGLGRVIREDNPYFAPSDTYSEPAGSGSTNYTYDSLGRVIFVRNADGTNVAVTFNRTKITDYDANGNEHEYIIDGFGQITKVREFNNDPILGHYVEPYNTTYQYDTAGNLVLITDALGNTFEFIFDSLGRKTRMNDPDLGIWTYEYDSADNIIRQTDSRNIATTIIYDALNRPNMKNTDNETTFFSYDLEKQGTLSNYTFIGHNKNYSYSFFYDDRLRPVHFMWNRDGSLFEKDVSFDSMDRIVKLISSETLDYVYNKQGKLQSIPGYVTDSWYNPFGSIVNRSTADMLTTRFAYDSLNNRLKTVQTGLVQELIYSYDGVGNILSINDTINNRYHSMQYDALNRMSSVRLGSDQYTYEYDALGRMQRSQENGNVMSYEYNGAQAHAPSAIMRRNASIEVFGARDLETGSRDRIYEFYLVNETGNSTNTSWMLSAGSLSTSANLTITQPILVLVEMNHSNAGEYLVNVSTGAERDTFLTSFGLKQLGLQMISNNASITISKFSLSNDIAEIARNVSWECNDLSSSQEFDVSGNGGVMIFIEENQSSDGRKNLNCEAVSDDGNASSETSYGITGLVVDDFNLVEQSTATKVVSFTAQNNWNSLIVGWNLSSSEQVITNSTHIEHGDHILVFEEFNYSQDGLKNVSARLTAPNLNSSVIDKLKIEATQINKYDRLDDNTSRQVISFFAKNNWINNLSLTWNISSPNIVNFTNVTNNASVLVISEENYVSGRNTPLINMLSTNFTAQRRDGFRIIPIDLLDYQIVRQNRSSTVAGFIIRNNQLNQSNVSWRMLTGANTIAGINQTVLNASKKVYVFVETNYSNTGVYSTTGFANSTTTSDNSTGVAIV